MNNQEVWSNYNPSYNRRMKMTIEEIMKDINQDYFHGLRYKVLTFNAEASDGTDVLAPFIKYKISIL